MKKRILLFEGASIFAYASSKDRNTNEYIVIDGKIVIRASTYVFSRFIQQLVEIDPELDFERYDEELRSALESCTRHCKKFREGKWPAMT